MKINPWNRLVSISFWLASVVGIDETISLKSVSSIPTTDANQKLIETNLLQGNEIFKW